MYMLLFVKSSDYNTYFQFFIIFKPKIGLRLNNSKLRHISPTKDKLLPKSKVETGLFAREKLILLIQNWKSKLNSVPTVLTH